MKLFFLFAVMISVGCQPSLSPQRKEWYEYTIREPHFIKYSYYKPLVKPVYIIEFCQVMIDMCWELNRWSIDGKPLEMKKPTIDCKLPDNFALHARVVKKPQEPLLLLDAFDLRMCNMNDVMRKFCNNYGVNIEFRSDKIILYSQQNEITDHSLGATSFSDL